MRALAILLLVAGCATSPSLTPHARPLTGTAADYDPLLAAIGNASVVLLGEETHGTREFYVERATITERLIREKGFTALAIEGAWSDAERIDRYIRGETNADPLGGLRWTWRNREFAELVERIREHNRTAAVKVSMYGLDLNGVEESRQALRGGATGFSAEQHARVVRNGELFQERRGSAVATWNLREQHMAVTLDRLQRHLIERDGTGKIVVWAHNSHAGDARATGRSRFGEWSLGQLVREHWPHGATFTVGFTTHTGTVLAAHEAGGTPRVQELRPSKPSSHGAVLHEIGLPRFLILLAGTVTSARPQRGVGVVYRAIDEYARYYRTATLSEQFDAVIHIDETTAVTPLD